MEYNAQKHCTLSITPTLLGPLETATLNHMKMETDRFRNVLSYLEFQTRTKSRNAVILNLKQIPMKEYFNLTLVPHLKNIYYSVFPYLI
jgi:hypothetical protein